MNVDPARLAQGSADRPINAVGGRVSMRRGLTPQSPRIALRTRVFRSSGMAKDAKRIRALWTRRWRWARPRRGCGSRTRWWSRRWRSLGGGRSSSCCRRTSSRSWRSCRSVSCRGSRSWRSGCRGCWRWRSTAALAEDFHRQQRRYAVNVVAA